MAEFAALSLGVSPSSLSWPGWQDLHPKGSSLGSVCRILSPGQLAGAVSFPTGPLCPGSEAPVSTIRSLPSPHISFGVNSPAIFFFFNWGIVSFYLTDRIFYYILPLFMYIIHQISSDVKGIWMVSQWSKTFPTYLSSLEVNALQKGTSLKTTWSISIFCYVHCALIARAEQQLRCDREFWSRLDGNVNGPAFLPYSVSRSTHIYVSKASTIAGAARVL